jgi:hypothetical protein
MFIVETCTRSTSSTSCKKCLGKFIKTGCVARVQFCNWFFEAVCSGKIDPFPAYFNGHVIAVFICYQKMELMIFVNVVRISAKIGTQGYNRT